jgi:CNT family concentrative nucleoside transporter
LPFEATDKNSLFVFAFQALPTVVLVATLGALLTYLRVIPYVSMVIGYVFKRVFKVRSSVGMLGAAKMFLGQFESYMLVKSDLAHMQKPEIFMILSLAFATTSASVMPIYANALASICPDAMRHIIISSVLGVISTFVICSIMMPNDESKDSGDASFLKDNPYPDIMTAISKGSSDGAMVWWSIVGSLIGIVALIAIINYLLALFPDIAGGPITLQKILGIVMYPFAWLIGIPEADLNSIAQILGTKVVLNETIAFFDLGKLHASYESVRASIYAINNFGNFACVGMTIGGLLAIVPSHSEIPSLGWRALIAGTLGTGISSSLMNLLF